MLLYDILYIYHQPPYQILLSSLLLYLYGERQLFRYDRLIHPQRHGVDAESRQRTLLHAKHPWIHLELPLSQNLCTYIYGDGTATITRTTKKSGGEDPTTITTKKGWDEKRRTRRRRRGSLMS